MGCPPLSTGDLVGVRELPFGEEESTGERVGLSEGDLVGLLLSTGALEGESVGCVEGEDEGELVGCLLGDVEGVLEGEEVGLLLGD